ncbi:MAG: LptA/OstA family protein, partial [Candidatus Omnitrophota bacterium]
MKQGIFKLSSKIILISAFLFSGSVYAQETSAKSKSASSPLTINADNVEYGAENKNVTATGNVEILYQGTKLTCQKLTVNTETKEGLAEGKVRLESDSGVIEGENLHYNFQASNGYLKNAIFRAAPYFGKARNIEKVNESQFTAFGGYATTCSFDHPHYRIKSKRINVFPGNKLQTKSDTFMFGDVPVASIPYFNQSFKDPLMHVQVSPGKRKDWGYYMLSFWRLNLADNVNGQVYFDARTKLGVAEGFGTNYLTPNLGKGDFKFYYTQESDSNLPAGTTQDKFQRYLLRWRHKWDIDYNTNFISEYYLISDEKRKILGQNSNFLKDYFYREFEKDAQPPTYAQLHHAFGYSSLDFLIQQRTNRWYNPGFLEKLPEVKFSMPSYRIGDTPFYFDNNSTGGTYNLKNSTTTPDSTIASTPDTHVNRLDTTN